MPRINAKPDLGLALARLLGTFDAKAQLVLCGDELAVFNAARFIDLSTRAASLLRGYDAEHIPSLICPHFRGGESAKENSDRHKEPRHCPFAPHAGAHQQALTSPRTRASATCFANTKGPSTHARAHNQLLYSTLAHLSPR